MEVNIPAKLVDKMKDQLKSSEAMNNISVFDTLQDHVVGIMRADAYLRYRQSQRN